MSLLCNVKLTYSPIKLKSRDADRQLLYCICMSHETKQLKRKFLFTSNALRAWVLGKQVCFPYLCICVSVTCRVTKDHTEFQAVSPATERTPAARYVLSAATDALMTTGRTQKPTADDVRDQQAAVHEVLRVRLLQTVVLGTCTALALGRQSSGIKYTI